MRIFRKINSFSRGSLQMLRESNWDRANVDCIETRKLLRISLCIGSQIFSKTNPFLMFSLGFLLSFGNNFDPFLFFLNFPKSFLPFPVRNPIVPEMKIHIKRFPDEPAKLVYSQTNTFTGSREPEVVMTDKLNMKILSITTQTRLQGKGHWILIQLK